MLHRTAFQIIVLVAILGSDECAWAQRKGTRPQLADVRIGVAKHYKVGHWTPVWVEAAGGDSLDGVHVEVTAPDSDGVATNASAPLQRSAAVDGRHTAVVYTKVGRIGAPIRIALIRNGESLDERTLPATWDANADSALFELPATGELLLSLGAAPFGLEEAFGSRDAAGGMIERRTFRITDIQHLPVDWFGYESMDVLVISAGDGELCRKLAMDEARYAALERWIELGGRLVVLCGGESARELLGESGALAGLVPGKFDDLVRLTETGPLEHFAEPAATIGRAGGGAALLVPRLVDVDGKIEAYAGRRASDLPLVIRAARGLGEIAFAAVDLTASPLAEWSGRTTFLQALIQPYMAGAQNEAPQTLVTLGYNDLSGALRQRLGRSFASVAPIGFPTVAALAIAYLLVLGPLDYLLVHRWLRLPLAAWITFPIIVILFGVGALALAEWRKGTGDQRVNRVEVVDVDAVTGQVRGTFWSAFYSPNARQFDLAVEVDRTIGETAAKDAQRLLSWWGLPGGGIGGMQAGGSNLGIVRETYRYTDKYELEEVPVLASATKSLVTRWTAPVNMMVEAQLIDEDGFATGSLANRTGQVLRDVQLLYGAWGYRLGDLADGAQIDVGEHLDPLSVKTMVTRRALGGSGSAAERDSTFVPESASAAELMNLMMFYEAAGGIGFAQLPHRYQAYCDLSRHLALGRAILVAEVDDAGSRLVDSAMGESIGDENGSATVNYRFVFPVQKQTD